MSEYFSPGNICPSSGTYEVVGPRGGQYGRTVKMQKGETFPPTPKANLRYKKSN